MKLSSILPTFLLGLTTFSLSVLAQPVADSDNDLSPYGPIETSGDDVLDTAIYQPIFADNTTIDGRANAKLFCESSAASPPIEWVHEAANRLIDNKSGKVCYQTNPYGSKCTKLYPYNSADISICNGGKKTGVKCTTAAWAAKHIGNHCRRVDGKTGGYYKFTELGLRIVIH